MKSAMLSALFAWSLCSLTVQAQFEVRGITPPGASTELRFSAATNEYYQILEGTTLENLSPQLSFVLGAASEVTVPLDPAALATNVRFYAVQAFDNCAPGDADGDGVDDLYELLRSPLLDPFDAFDVRLDHDLDGVATIQEYRTGTDPQNAADRFCFLQSQLNEWAATASRQPVVGANAFDLAPDEGGPLSASIDGRSGIAQAHLDGNGYPDVISLDPDANDVLIWLGQVDGSIAAPQRQATGGDGAVAVSVGAFLGRPVLDLAIGHSDGQLTILQGQGDGTFVLRSDLTQTGLGQIVDLTAADFDGDGDLDIAVSGTDRATVLFKDNSPLDAPPIVNGAFDNNLQGWMTTIVGHAPDEQAGTVTTEDSRLQLSENQSFAVGVRQTFKIPPNPQTLSIDIVQLDLEAAEGIPDAFDAALLDAAGAPLTAVVMPGASSFFNANPGGERLASGVTRSGNTITLDLSGQTPGTDATLRLDMSGHPVGTRSRVVLDAVRVLPETLLVDTFTPLALSGPFGEAAGLAHCDENGDGAEDILLDDPGLGALVLHTNDGTGGFTRSIIPIPNYHCP